ncbi:MAG: amidohydrolase family protein [Haliea sp.]
MKQVLIKNGFVVTMDPELGNIDGADVLIEGSRIAAVGKQLVAADAEQLDADGMIVMPGFVDTHRHIWQGALRGIAADWSIFNYLGGIRMNAATLFRPEDMYAAQYLGALEAINAGVTTVADYCHNLNSPDHAFEAIRGLQDAGLRSVWCYGFNAPPMPSQVFSTVDERIRFGRELARDLFSSSDALLSFGVAPEEAPLWLDDQAGASQFAFAREVGARIFWHCNATNHADGQPGDMMRIQRLGLAGDDMVLVHMNCASPVEWQQVADCGAWISCTPDTEMQMGMGAPVTVTAREAGISPTFGTDITSNNSADMFTTLRIALQVAREQLNRPRQGEFYDGVPIRCDEALDWGTRAGAAALGLEGRIGSLVPGKQADIVLLNTRSVTLAGWDRSNPAATIIQQASTADVDTVLVAGRVRKRHGKLCSDVAGACRLLESSAEFIAERAREHGGFYISPEETLRRMGIEAPSKIQEL